MPFAVPPRNEDARPAPALRGANRLIRETSPYLLQHAHNPVDWYPWGDEAFERARREDKPVFLSIGYSSCHWCHVMEAESFSNGAIARALNDSFISIKVDREERPDLDELYMTATQLVTGRGGWPNSLFLTPDRKPWYAGTYYPPEDHGGQVGFKTLLSLLAEIWRTRRDDCTKQADQLAAEVARVASGRFAAEGEFTRKVVSGAIEDLESSFDAQYGGFAEAPKFPAHGAHALLLYEARRTGVSSVRDLAAKTLSAMARGGIRDHVGGGFHRYSTDAHWLVPHFEKMLYDNAQLARAYTEGYSLTAGEEYRGVAAEIFEWALSEMADPLGGFYSAIDADSEGEEGRFYLWRRSEIVDALGAREADVFCRVYGVEPDGNFRDEASSLRLTGRRSSANILHLVEPLAGAAARLKVDLAEFKDRLERDRQVLLDLRNSRVRPRTDDKVLAGWNGLMLGSLAYAGNFLSAPRYILAAAKCADFILAAMVQNGRLMRTWRKGQTKVPAYLDDYAAVADGLVDLYLATGLPRWLDSARSLAETMILLFHDSEGGFFFAPAGQADLLARQKDGFDKALPSGNALAARLFLRLFERTGEERYLNLARETLEYFAGLMEKAPAGTHYLVLAAAMYFDAVEARAAAPHAAPRAAAPDAPDAEARKRPVSLRAFASTLEPYPGHQVEVAFEVSIDAGWHMDSRTPLAARLIACELMLAEGVPAVLADVVYPTGSVVTLSPGAAPLSVYDGAVWIRTKVRVRPEASGPLPLTFTLHFQCCSDRECLAPDAIDLTVLFEIARGAMPGHEHHRDLFARLNLQPRP